ncbi:hypothetical protein K4A83_12595 [Spirulina subsalsa FACHB-351]|uniref:SPOR domain-containing protein n=1 Tax=Spirulina subsalsa FACHB-351 TaxID=234711 RepID=A0ABT3L6G4_9CYAN|nr:hypothetical protein [Spirulina subsalsa]MCW6037100.1 hypothetical protein [Spirulina subsalsa FACHB-351]
MKNCLRWPQWIKSRGFCRGVGVLLGWGAFPMGTVAQIPTFFPPAIPQQAPGSVPVVGESQFFGGYSYDNVNFPPRLSPNSRFSVQVPYEGPWSLEMARRVDREAFLRSDQMIQVGRFGYGDNALNRTRELEREGLRVRILEEDGNFRRVVYETGGGSFPPSVGVVPPAVVPPTAPAYRVCPDPRSGPTVNLSSRGYLVIIPTGEEQVLSLCQNVRRIVDLNRFVVIRDQPRGLHIAVGFFPRLEEARYWQSRLQSEGFMDARVFYNR